MRSESFHMSDSLIDGVSGRLYTDKQPGLDVAGPTVSNVRRDLDHSAGSASSDQLRLAHYKQEIIKFSIPSTHRLTI
jgi:hypothetical protein